MMNPSTAARFALFTRKPKDTDEVGKEYPLMFGAIENKEFKINVSAFKRTNDAGKDYLSLSIANEGDAQVFGGMLFKSDKKGKEGEYFGFINETYVDVVDGKKVYSHSEWQSSINAKVTTAEPGAKVSKYIGGNIRPSNKRPAPVTPPVGEEEDDIPF